MIIDFHNHIGVSFDGGEQTIASLKKDMKKYGIDKAVVFPIDDKRMDLLEASFDLLEKTCKDKALIPFIRIDPKKVSADELGKYLDMGFYGVKLHSRAEDFEPLDKKFFPLYQKISDSGKPLLFHSKRYHVKKTDPEVIVQIGKLFPKLKLVIAHFANSQPLVFNYVKKHDLKNVYFDTSISGTDFYIRMVGRKIGFDKLIYGSDTPYADQEVELLKIKKLKTTAENRKKVLSGNAIKILGL